MSKALVERKPRYQAKLGGKNISLKIRNLGGRLLERKRDSRRLGQREAIGPQFVAVAIIRIGSIDPAEVARNRLARQGGRRRVVSKVPKLRPVYVTWASAGNEVAPASKSAYLNVLFIGFPDRS